jgi:glycosyltransferase involved in cell wall biosynthesis
MLYLPGARRTPRCVASTIPVMKVLIYAIDFAPKIGGEETYLLVLGRGLVNYAWEHLQGVAPADEEVSSPKTTVLVVTRTAPNGFKDASLPFPIVRQPGLKTLWRLVGEADVVHISGPVLLPLIFGLVRRRPVVIQHHMYHSICPNGLLLYAPNGSLCPGHFMERRYHECLRCCAATAGWRTSFLMLFGTFLRRWLCRKVAANVGITRYVSDQIALPRRKTILYGIPDPLSALRHNDQSPPSAICFAYVGRLVPEKGLGLLLDAASFLNKEGRNFRLKIIGDGPERGCLEVHCRKLSLQHRIEFTGSLRDEALDSALADVSVIVMPSIWRETAGLAAIEQMMRGRVVIAADIGGLGEVVGDTALKFPVGDTEALAGCLRRILNDPDLQRELGSRARARATKLFHEQRMIKEHQKIYNDVRRFRGGEPNVLPLSD